MTKYIDPRAKLFQHLDVLAALQQDWSTEAPINIEIDLSNRCNLGCEACHFAYTHTRGPWASRYKENPNMLDMGDLMDEKLADSIIHQLVEAGVKSITWTGGGEPTLHPQFDWIVADAAEVGFPQGIYTNGTLISEARARLLKKMMAWVYVSLDRHTRESYKAYKKADSFDKVIEGVQRLVSAPGEATIGLGFLVDSTNWAQAAQMAELGCQLKVDYVQFRPTIEFDMARPSKPVGDRSWINDFVAWAKTIEAHGVIVDVDRFLDYLNWTTHPYAKCWWSTLQTVITPNGKVWCCVNRRGFPNDCIGDLTKETFASIWAKVRAFTVDSKCRVMCRGHIPNLALDGLMRDINHKEFV